MYRKPFYRHLHSQDDLVTSRTAAKARRAWFKAEKSMFLERYIFISAPKIEDAEFYEELVRKKIIRTILATLCIAGIPYRWRDRYALKWYKMQNNLNNLLRVEDRADGISWQSDGKDRILLYNLTVPLVENNVDLCLCNATPKSLDETDPKSYIALGELKGGIDPAGADEHWKTARTALERIRRSFANVNHTPHTFFIGAAIEKKMAAEIWNELKIGVLSNAANLNEDNQVASISHWLCNL